jgi:hypothetical protein
VCRLKHVEQLRNVGIINSTTRLHLVGFSMSILLFALVTKCDKLMLYREIMAVFSEIHTKHINTVCGQNTGFLNVEAGGT